MLTVIHSLRSVCFCWNKLVSMAPIKRQKSWAISHPYRIPIITFKNCWCIAYNYKCEKSISVYMCVCMYLFLSFCLSNCPYDCLYVFLLPAVCLSHPYHNSVVTFKNCWCIAYNYKCEKSISVYISVCISFTLSACLIAHLTVCFSTACCMFESPIS